MTPLCSIVGCGRRHKARGYCSSHYQRWWTTGDAHPQVPIHWQNRGHGLRPRSADERVAFDLTPAEIRQVGEVVEALAQHALSFVWKPLACGEFNE